MTDENTLPAGGDGPSRAVDGGRVPGACNTLAEFIRSLEDGQFDADCYEKLKGLSAAMNDHAWNNGGKAKGKVTITLDFIQEGTVVEIKSAFKVVEPVDRRPKSVMWTTEDHRFTRTRPGQRELFGIRDVSGGASARDVG
ncbi:MAG: hypothetical protein J0G94_11495 [Sphingomonadales bacterium]|nr:hypothetical protein [Sphingomonadales bacterium]MBN9321914.1 hypothetical protein [Delftia acidovorans]